MMKRTVKRVLQKIRVFERNSKICPQENKQEQLNVESFIGEKQKLQDQGYQFMYALELVFFEKFKNIYIKNFENLKNKLEEINKEVIKITKYLRSSLLRREII